MAHRGIPAFVAVFLLTATSAGAHVCSVPTEVAFPNGAAILLSEESSKLVKALAHAKGALAIDSVSVAYAVLAPEAESASETQRLALVRAREATIESLFTSLGVSLQHIKVHSPEVALNGSARAEVEVSVECNRT